MRSDDDARRKRRALGEVGKSTAESVSPRPYACVALNYHHATFRKRHTVLLWGGWSYGRHSDGGFAKWVSKSDMYELSVT